MDILHYLCFVSELNDILDPETPRPKQSGSKPPMRSTSTPKGENVARLSASIEEQLHVSVHGYLTEFYSSFRIYNNRCIIIYTLSVRCDVDVKCHATSHEVYFVLQHFYEVIHSLVI